MQFVCLTFPDSLHSVSIMPRIVYLTCPNPLTQLSVLKL